MYLCKVKIENFRGIRSGVIELQENTLLIGENNSGKSTLLEAICKVLSIRPEEPPIRFHRHEFHQIREEGQWKDAGPIRIELTFRERKTDEWSFLQSNEMGIHFPDDRNRLQSLTVEVTASPGDMEGTAHWRIMIPGRNTNHLDDDPSVLEWIRRLSPVFRIRGGILTGIPEYERGQLSGERGGDYHAGIFSDQIRAGVESLLSGITYDLHAEIRAGYQAALQYLNDMTDLFLPEGTEQQNIIREILGRRDIAEDSAERPVRQNHGSAAEMIGMLLFTTALLQSGTQLPDPASEPVFIIEDPEANLHPMTLESVRMLINRLKWQKIITTQSGDFLSGYALHEMLRITRRHGNVRQWRIEPGSLRSEELRRLSYHIRMKRGSASFARCWLLVEGESEIWLLPHLARLCGYELAMEGVICVEFAQCGIAPLIKAAVQLGIEWHLLADGDAAGKAYIETARHFANLAGDDHDLRFTRLKERDIEHHLYFNGYAGVYHEFAEIPLHDDLHFQPRRIIGRAIHRQSKPFMAIAAIEAMGREGAPGVPPVLFRLVETCVRLARHGIKKGS